MNQSKLIYCCLLLLFYFPSCKEKDQGCELDSEILKTNLNVEIVRLENEFFKAESAEDFLYLLEKYPEFSDKYLLSREYESKLEMANELFVFHQDTIMLELYQEVMSNFPELDSLEKEITNAFKYIQYYFPEFKIPKVYTYVSGFATDLYLDDEMIVIGLDYYLPFEHKFQPPDLPQYISNRYQRPYIVPMIVMAISSKFNKTDLAQSSLLAEMVYYGKAYHFTKSILPCTSDEYIIGYTPEEIVACFDNEEYIWSYFVENDLFFETNPFVIRKYTGEAPATDEISPDAPGRIGRWLGWNIVDDFRFNNELDLKELMNISDTGMIFRQSGYKPRP
ncbi:gliding motility lipoprotein GldB [Aquiflexum lacus]|uniref:gliding motility lipoprotein GldB n=1 Tax=Aquiflexum lacus TaxID=2483805 RepID=UPI00189450FD|nr:gliding motility lipoprotein GldB [Aquiflexum lacus]